MILKENVVYVSTKQLFILRDSVKSAEGIWRFNATGFISKNVHVLSNEKGQHMRKLFSNWPQDENGLRTANQCKQVYRNPWYKGVLPVREIPL